MNSNNISDPSSNKNDRCLGYLARHSDSRYFSADQVNSVPVSYRTTKTDDNNIPGQESSANIYIYVLVPKSPLLRERSGILRENNRRSEYVTLPIRWCLDCFQVASKRWLFDRANSYLFASFDPFVGSTDFRRFEKRTITKSFTWN